MWLCVHWKCLWEFEKLVVDFEKSQCKVDKWSKIIMACCIFHNLCQMMDMPKSMVCDVHKKGDPLVGFCGQHVLVIKKVMQQRRLEKGCGMDYLHQGWSIIQ